MLCSSTTTSEDHHHHPIQMAYPSPSNNNFLFQSLHDHDQNDHLLPSLPEHFHGGGGAFLMKRSMSFSGDDELSDDGSQLGEKKKRLNLQQVKTLEKSFELGNKLDPERKLQLAKALGLQPRQVAIWFQNRRARWKTKQLERDYQVLKKQFDAVKAHNDTLQALNNKLHAQLLQLKSGDSNSNEIRGGGGVGVNLKKETDEGSWSNGSDNSSDVNLDRSTTVTPREMMNNELSSKQLFNTSLIRPTTILQLQASTRPDLQIVQDQTHLCNMFGAIEEDQPGMWSWPDQHHFH